MRLNRLFRLILFNVVLVLSLAFSEANAKEYTLFSLDFDEQKWVELAGETPNELGINNVVLLNVDSQSILGIITQDIGITVTDEEIEARCQYIVDYYRQNGLLVKESGFDKARGRFFCKGEYNALPFEMYLCAKGKILVAISAIGENSQPCFDLADKIKFKS